MFIERGWVGWTDGMTDCHTNGNVTMSMDEQINGGDKM